MCENMKQKPAVPLLQAFFWGLPGGLHHQLLARNEKDDTGNALKGVHGIDGATLGQR